jgi:hypothetical protein
MKLIQLDKQQYVSFWVVSRFHAFCIFLFTDKSVLNGEET